MGSTVTAALGKDLVGLEHLSADQIRLILDTAEPFKEVSERPIKKVPASAGRPSSICSLKPRPGPGSPSSSPKSASRRTP